ncbi:hypothetical protein [Streptomyces sp. NPDC001880]
MTSENPIQGHPEGRVQRRSGNLRARTNVGVRAATDTWPAAARGRCSGVEVQDPSRLALPSFQGSSRGDRPVRAIGGELRDELLWAAESQRGARSRSKTVMPGSAARCSAHLRVELVQSGERFGVAKIETELAAGADASCATVDQHVLPGLQRGMVDERLPDGERGKRDGRGPVVVQGVRLGEHVRGNGDVLGGRHRRT